MKKALITGITGQDGSYLAELLLSKGYSVCGMYRRVSGTSTDKIQHLFENKNFSLVYGDLQDSSSLYSLMESFCPDEVYNLGAQSDVGASFKMPEVTLDTNAVGTLRLLEAIRNKCPKARFYQASSSEMFGKVKETPQNEATPFNVRSPYGASKLCAYWLTVNYRDSYGMFACNGILFNHESPRRGQKFVTQKIITHLNQVFRREREVLELGNMDSKRDWGYAGEYVEAMWRMLQQDSPDDYVIATGKTHSVREFVELAAKRLGWEISWSGAGTEEVGHNQHGQLIVKINPEFYRPAEVDLLVGDGSKAKKKLDWEPKVDLEELIEIMGTAEMERAQN